MLNFCRLAFHLFRVGLVNNQGASQRDDDHQCHRDVFQAQQDRKGLVKSGIIR
jgi:hypothetical protein